MVRRKRECMMGIEWDLSMVHRMGLHPFYIMN